MGIKPIDTQVLLQQQEALTAAPKNGLDEHAIFFERSKKQRTPDVLLLKYKNVFVSYAGTVFSGLKTVKHSRSYYYRWKLGFKYLLYNYLLRKKVKLDDRQEYILVYNNLCDCYFHWMTEAIPRLFLVKRLLPSHKIILPSIYNKFHLKSLAPFGIDTNDIVYIPSQSYVQVEKLTMPSFTGKEGIYNSVLLNEIRNFYSSFYRTSSNLEFDKLYIKRKKMSIRHVLNEEEVIETLSRYGFKDVFFEDYSFEEQVQMASNAKVMVSIHGAGLTNMLFMSKGTKVLEFRKANETGYLHYYNLASALGIDYYYLFGTPQDLHQSSKEANLTIDVLGLNAVLKSMLEE